MRTASVASAQAASHATQASALASLWNPKFPRCRRRYRAATDARSRTADCAACKLVQRRRGLRLLAPMC